MIRDRLVANPVKEKAAAQAKKPADAGEPLPNTDQALGDIDPPPERPAPVNAEDGRVTEILLISERRCGEAQRRLPGQGRRSRAM